MQSNKTLPEQETIPFHNGLIGEDLFSGSEQTRIFNDLSILGEKEFRKEIFNLFIEHYCLRQKVPLKDLIQTIEKTMLFQALSRFNGNQRETAEFLGVKHTTLNEKIKKYQIRFKKEPF